MHRLFAPLALAACLLTVAPLCAEEPTADFIRRMRARYGPRLAEAYVDRLQKEHGNPTDDRLILEMARTKIELASAEASTSERLRLAGEAQGLVDQVLKKHEKDDLTGEARLVEIQVRSQQGHAILADAQRLNGDAQTAEVNRAREQFEKAGTQIEQVLGQLNEQLARYKGDAKTLQEKQARQALSEAINAAEFDQAVNFLDQAGAVPPGSKPELTLTRNKVIDKGRTLFEKIAARDPKQPTAYLARAWVIECFWLRDQREEQKMAQQKYEELLRETIPVAEEAQRLLGSFRMQHLLRVLDKQASVAPGEDPIAEAETVGEKWRTAYREHQDSPQGLVVRYVLAEAYFREAEGLKNSPARQKERYARAQELFGELADGEGEYALRARQRRNQIFLALNGGDPEKAERVPLAELKTFDELYGRAQFEAARLGDDAERYAKDPAKLAEQRQQRFARILEALNRALALARGGTVKVPEVDINGAVLMLARFHLANRDPVKAIQEGEGLARRRPPAEQSPQAATCVLDSYEQVLSRPKTYHVAETELADYRQRQDTLIQYMAATWPTAEAGYAARHLRAEAFHDQKKLPEAIEQLAQIGPEYSKTIITHYQLATWSQEAEAAHAKALPSDPDGQTPWLTRATQALEGMPSLPANASPRTAHVYIRARLLLAQEYYKGRKYELLEKLAQPLLEGLDKGTIRPGEDVKKALYPDVLSIGLFAAYGRADDRYRAEPPRYKESADILAPVIDRIRGDAYVELLQKNVALRKALLELALRAFVQDGRIPQALEALKLLQKYSGDESDAGTVAVLEPVIGLLMSQIETQRAAGKKAELETSIARFTAFVDEVSKQPKGFSPEFLRVLGECYSGADRHGKAAELFKQVPEPRAEGGNKPDPAKLHNYQLCRILYVRELRLDGKLDEAEKALDELKKAPDAAGSAALRLKKEELHLLDARGKYEDSHTQWVQLANKLARRLDESGSEEYFECYYYMVNAWYRYAQSLDEPRKTEITRKAAGFLVTLQANYPKLGGGAAQALFQQLLDKETPLREQYDQLKAKK